MTTWTKDELRKIEAAEELELASVRPDGTRRNPVTIWVVRVGDSLYVRSWKGRTSGWFHATQVRHAGHIKAGGVGKDVSFVAEADDNINDQIDTAYRTKYPAPWRTLCRSDGRCSGASRNDQARAALSDLVVHQGDAADSMDHSLPSNRIAAIAKFHASQTAKLCADKAMQIFGGYGLAKEYRVSWLKSYADLFFTGEGSANVQKILIAEDALGH
jgi:hypothetical protein